VDGHRPRDPLISPFHATSPPPLFGSFLTRRISPPCLQFFQTARSLPNWLCVIALLYYSCVMKANASSDVPSPPHLNILPKDLPVTPFSPLTVHLRPTENSHPEGTDHYFCHSFSPPFSGWSPIRNLFAAKAFLHTHVKELYQLLRVPVPSMQSPEILFTDVFERSPRFSFGPFTRELFCVRPLLFYQSPLLAALLMPYRYPAGSAFPPDWDRSQLPPFLFYRRAVLPSVCYLARNHPL